MDKWYQTEMHYLLNEEKFEKNRGSQKQSLSGGRMLQRWVMLRVMVRLSKLPVSAGLMNNAL